MRRRLIPGHSPYEGVAGFSRAVVVGDHVHVAGHGADPGGRLAPPEGAYEQARLCLEIVGERARRAGSRPRARRPDAASTSPTPAHFEESRVRTARSSATSGRRRRASSSRLLDPRWQVEIEAEAMRRREAGRPAVDHGQGRGSQGGSVLDHTFGQGDPYTLGVEEEYMLLDARDVRPRPAHRHGARRDRRARARGADQRRADAVGARDRDAGVPDRRPTSTRELRDAARAT